MIKAIAVKCISGAPQRVTRAHSEKGQAALKPRDLLDAIMSGATTIRRVAFGIRPRLPWLTYPALRALRGIVGSSSRIFEFGGGMSTVYFAEVLAASEVITVEDDGEWFLETANLAPRARVFSVCGDEYINKIKDFPLNYFDLIVVDGTERVECFRAAEPHLKKGGHFILDDTDKDFASKGGLYVLDRLVGASDGYRTQRYTGWIPGSFWVKETTICCKL